MKLAVVDFKICNQCVKCTARKSCPTKALFQVDSEEPASVDTKLCYGCGKCISECPYSALSVKEL
ncbi:MAG TPA: 4Fe-4S dicluster domain-containing protein [Candidatus Aquicultor sp.]